MLIEADRPRVSVPAATMALARVETRHLLRGAFFWGGLILSVALGVVWSWTRMPSWDTFSQNAGMSSLVLATSLLIGAHLATGRDHRAGADETTRTMPAGRRRRGVAMLVVVPVAAVSGVVLYLIELLLLMPTWPVGRFDPWAAAVVVVIPAIGAVVGVLAGRLMPAVAAGPLSAVAFTVLLIGLRVLPSSPGGYGEAVWLVPNQPWEVGASRPTGWHLLYLLGVLVAITAVAAWRAWPKISAAVLIAAVASAGLAVDRQSSASVIEIHYPEDTEPLTGVAVLSCQADREVRYCALPHHEGWIGLWREAVEPVIAHLPPGAVRPAVRQVGNSHNLQPMTPGMPEIITAASWGRIGAWADDSRGRMTRDYVVAAIGVRRQALFYDSCEGAGQHRTVAALWLLAQATPGDVARLRSGELRLPRVNYGDAELRAAVALLDRPYAEVAGHLSAHWAELLDPSSTALAGIGVTLTPPPVPATPEPEEPGAGGGICR
ncbi:hypothetical protein QLQ12_30465 [Actinoplanes sp. NEAU-A12]|uniref:ABC transporter permease n=1 Tax=Actinoplanes sandaracinus TaxID=3045177 RepID=A0ABT6WH61_9ACTN|nr:hypothetical protein [Actinoplanes sandaracinus]MDI6099054.1 hypothetical protein [Actinoplanes sandaracinus]MDI6102949.1 hypothetical protein [Actinoplanes sandaracinus]